MAEEGAYPFNVFLRNTFGADGPQLNVTHIFRPYYEYDQPIGNGNGGENNYKIKPGEVVCFPLFWNDEGLVINLDSNPGKHYFIWTGVKARCYFDPDIDDRGEDLEFIPSPLGKGEDEKGKFHRGGSVKVKTPDSDWTLTIRKYSPDPEEDTVTIGEEPPG